MQIVSHLLPYSIQKVIIGCLNRSPFVAVTEETIFEAIVLMSYYVTCAQHEYVFACSSLYWRFNIQIGWCFWIPASDCLKLCAANFSPEDVGFTRRALVLYWPNAHRWHAVVWSWNAVHARVLSLAELSLPAWMIFGWLIIQIEWLETRLDKNWPDLKSWCKSVRKL